jgi:hypothetical protein
MEPVTAYLILSQVSPEDIDESHEKVTEYLVTGPRFEPGTSQYKPRALPLH